MSLSKQCENWACPQFSYPHPDTQKQHTLYSTLPTIATMQGLQADPLIKMKLVYNQACLQSWKEKAVWDWFKSEMGEFDDGPEKTKVLQDLKE